VLLRVALHEGARIDVEALKRRLRGSLQARMPAVRFSFEPADIVSDVMSFGSPTPVEVAVTGPNFADDRAFAAKVRDELAKVPSLRDLQYAQALDYPTVNVEIDRERAGLSGVTAEEVSRSLVAATSSSRFVVPNYWVDRNSGTGYQVQVEIPPARMDSVKEVGLIPISQTGTGRLIALRDVAQVTEGTMQGEVDRYNMRRTISMTANIEGEDLGRVARHIERARQAAGDPPRGVTVAVRGQIAPMEEMFRGLTAGLGLAILVILLLLMAYFQSFRLGIIVMSTVPAVLVGVTLALLVTGTTLNIQSFMGAIMAVGVAVANAILLLTFAERRRLAGAPATAAAIEGATARLRPIAMTSLAMLAGMVPMALALGEGGEQTAPLARAVIGGLSAATLATLTVLPAVFALVQARATTRSMSLHPHDKNSSHYVGHGGEPTAVAPSELDAPSAGAAH
jgi:multidrug efflux pump subunit AcrB